MEQEQYNYAIVLSAGRGSRMGGDLPKQYQLLGGKPVLYYSLQAFEESRVDGVVLVVEDGMQDYVEREIIKPYGFSKIIAMATGGKERYHSVYAGLRKIPKEAVVLIHDGARPFVTVGLIHRMMEKAAKGVACVPALPVKDTIKEAENGIVTGTPQRDRLYAVQTPQAFGLSLLLKAYEIFWSRRGAAITDDAMLVEQMLGERVCLVEGEPRNIKLTTPEDMMLAELFLRENPRGAK